MPAAACSQPQAADRAHRCREADRVPVAVRRAQASVDVVRVELAGEDLRQQRVSAHHHRRDDYAPEQRLPARGQRARKRHRGAEERRVGEHAARVAVGVIRLYRPHDRERGQDGERRQQCEGRQPETCAQAWSAAQQEQRDGRSGPERERHLDPRHAVQRQAAAGEEDDQAEARGNRQRRRPGGEGASARRGRRGGGGAGGRPRAGGSGHGAREHRDRRFSCGDGCGHGREGRARRTRARTRGSGRGSRAAGWGAS